MRYQISITYRNIHANENQDIDFTDIEETKVPIIITMMLLQEHILKISIEPMLPFN